MIRGGGAEFYRHYIMTLHHQHFHWMHTYYCTIAGYYTRGHRRGEKEGRGRREGGKGEERGREGEERGREGGGEREGRCSPLVLAIMCRPASEEDK